MFLACFSVAEVLSVSAVPCWWRAVVMAVSCRPASVAAVMSLVSTSPRGCVLCAKKFAQRAENTPISAFLGLLGELFRGSAGGEGALGELFRGSADGGAALGEFFRGNAAGSPVLGELFRRHHRTHSRPRCWKATLRELCCGAGVGAPSRPDVPNVPTGTVGISPGGRRGPGAWPARRKAASRRSDSPAPPTRRPSRSTGTSERSRGR